MATPSWLPAGWFPGDSLPIIAGSQTDDIVTLIARRVRRGVPSGSNMEVEIVSEIVHAQRKLEEGPTLPWFLKKTAPVVVAANTSEVAFDDTGFAVIRLQHDKPLAYVDPTGVAAEPIDVPQESELEYLHANYPGTATVPRQFYVEDAACIVRPVPTQEITYNLRFYRKDTEPVLGAATLWTSNFPDLIMNMAGLEVATTLYNDKAAARFEKGLAIARSRYVKAVQAREDAGQNYVMGD